MPISIIVLLSLVQGVTEFLPISSSGHLVIIWEGAELMSVPVEFTDPYAQRAIDVAAHVGTLLAVVIFYWRDMLSLLGGALGLFGLRFNAPATRRFLMLVVASIPLVIAGGLWSLISDGSLERQLWVIGLASIVFGLVIWWFDISCPEKLEEKELTFGRSIVFGLFQVLALIPGTSRSGITMAAGRALGFTRAAGTKIALLLSVPAILAAGTLEALKLLTSDTNKVPEGLWQTAGMVAGLCAISAFITLWLFTRFLPKTGFTPYVLYRIGLGALVLGAAFALRVL